MKINKLILIAVVAVGVVSVLMSSCAKNSLPHPKYRGQAPRGPSR